MRWGSARCDLSQARTTHSGNTAPPRHGRPDLFCHRCRAWGAESFLEPGCPSPSPFTGNRGSISLSLQKHQVCLCPRGSLKAPPHSTHATPVSIPIFTLRHSALSCNFRQAQIHTPDSRPKLPPCLQVNKTGRPCTQGQLLVWSGKRMLRVNHSPLTGPSKGKGLHAGGHIMDEPDPFRGHERKRQLCDCTTINKATGWHLGPPEAEPCWPNKDFGFYSGNRREPLGAFEQGHAPMPFAF